MQGDHLITVSSLWVGESLSWIEELALVSWARVGYPVKLYCYDSISVPKDVTVEDANMILERSWVFRNPGKSTTYAGFSNLFRYTLLQKKAGEVWIDADMLAGLNPLPRTDYLFAYEGSGFINGAILKLPSESHELRALLAEATNRSKVDFKWGELGPKLITSVALEYGIDLYAMESHSFYEVGPLEVWKLFSAKHKSEMDRRLETSMGIHLWNEALKISRVNLRNRNPQIGSFLHGLMLETGVRTTGRQQISRFELIRWQILCRLHSLKNRICNLVRQSPDRRL